VSNCPEYTIDHFIKFAKIKSHITDTFSHGENYLPKHENINLLVKKYKLQTPVYIGDTESDYLQSQKAGVPFIFMSYGFGTCDQAAISFDSFKSFALYFLNLPKKNN